MECPIDRDDEAPASEFLIRVNATSGDGTSNEFIVADDATINDGMGILQLSKTDLTNGGSMSISRLVPADDMVIGFDPIDSGHLVNLLILFSGATSLSCIGADQQLITPALGCGFRYCGTPVSYALEKWVEVRSVSISLPPPLLEGYLGDEASPFFRRILDATGDDHCITPFSVSNEMRVAMAQNIAPGLTGTLRQLQLETAALMFIMLVAQATSGFQEAPQRPLSNREHRAAQEAYERLTSSLQAPPPLTELARSVNLTDKRLNTAFRELFGGTVFEVLRNLRLEQARNLIEHGDMTVKEIAWHVGYSHVSNFTSAFTAVFGSPPASYARNRPPRLTSNDT